MLKSYEQLPASQVAPAKADQQYKTYPGRVVFEQLGLTRLNTTPINIHRDAAVDGLTLSTLPPWLRMYENPARVAEDFTVDGCELAVFADGEWIPQENIIHAGADVVWQDVTPPSVMGEFTQWFREWRRLDTGDWLVTMYSRPSGALEATEESSVTMPAAFVAFVYFPYDLLYKNQWTYWRMEEIKWAIQRESTEFALSILLVGELGRNADDALNKLNQGRRIAALPGRNSNAIRVSDSTIMDKLAVEYESLKADYFNATYLIDMGNQPNRPVAQDSAIRIAPQVRYRDSVRTAITAWYEQFEGVSISFTSGVNMLQSDNPNDTESQNG